MLKKSKRFFKKNIIVAKGPSVWRTALLYLFSDNLIGISVVLLNDDAFFLGFLNKLDRDR